jgi:hypothetical protein
MSQHKQHRSSRASRLSRKLAAYATGSAALVAADCHAAIVHTDLGPSGVMLAGLDVNGDGVNEFDLRTEFHSWTFGCYTTSSGSFNCGTSHGGGSATRFMLQGVSGNRVVLVEGRYGLIRPMAEGESVHFDLSAATHANLASYRVSDDANGACEFGCTTTGGSFIHGRRAFIGLLIELDGEGPYSGWADIETVGAYGDYVLHGFAYESTLREPIIAGAVPEPPALLLLATGAAGLVALRRHRRGKLARE